MSLEKNIQNEKEVNKLDLRGKVCPMTFVNTKLSLEKLKSGEFLEVLLDFPPAVENVPENCRRQNLAKVVRITPIKQNKSYWELIFEKI